MESFVATYGITFSVDHNQWKSVTDGSASNHYYRKSLRDAICKYLDGTVVGSDRVEEIHSYEFVQAVLTQRALTPLIRMEIEHHRASNDPVPVDMYNFSWTFALKDMVDGSLVYTTRTPQFDTLFNNVDRYLTTPGTNYLCSDESCRRRREGMFIPAEAFHFNCPAFA